MYGKKNKKNEKTWWRIRNIFDFEEFVFESDEENELEEIKEAQSHGEPKHLVIEEMSIYKDRLDADQTGNSTFHSVVFPSWKNKPHTKRRGGRNSFPGCTRFS